MRHFRQEWIEALESGRYPQAFGSYIDGKKRCAVGVGFEVLAAQDAKPNPSKPAVPELPHFRFYSLLGLTMRQGILVERMNDYHHLSHAEIARLLRQLDSREAMIAAEHDPTAWEDRKRPKQSEESSSPK